MDTNNSTDSVKNNEVRSEGEAEVHAQVPNPSTDVLLSQWQTCVEMANSVSQRRDSMNNIFITLNLAIAAAVSFTWSLKSIFLLIAGVVICIIWCQFINNYKLLNEAKFDVINALELKLGSTPFADEWKKLQGNRHYKDGTKLEKGLAITFVILYSVAIVVLIALKVIETLGCHC